LHAEIGLQQTYRPAGRIKYLQLVGLRPTIVIGDRAFPEGQSSIYGVASLGNVTRDRTPKFGENLAK
jgi:hypothetical protein